MKVRFGARPKRRRQPVGDRDEQGSTWEERKEMPREASEREDRTLYFCSISSLICFQRRVNFWERSSRSGMRIVAPHRRVNQRMKTQGGGSVRDGEASNGHEKDPGHLPTRAQSPERVRSFPVSFKDGSLADVLRQVPTSHPNRKMDGRQGKSR